MNLPTSLLRALAFAAVAALGLSACDRDRSGPEPRSDQAARMDSAPDPSATAARDSAAPADTGGNGTASAPGSGAGAASSGANPVIEDNSITTRVKTALLADPQVQGLQIDVETRDRSVTLRGQVAEQAQAERAVAIARGVEGVASVNSRLTVSQG